MTERCAAEIHDHDFEYGVITVRCVRPAGHPPDSLHVGVGVFNQRIEWGGATPRAIGNSIGEVLSAGRFN